MSLLLRLGFTIGVMAIVIWLLVTGRPLGALLIVPAIAIWLRRGAESGRFARYRKRLAR